MPKPQKPAGGAKAAEPSPTPATETPPVTETPVVETPETPAPTPEEIQAQVDAIFSPVNSAVNAKIQEAREKEPKAEDEPASEDLPQSDALDGGEKTGSEEPENPTEPETSPEPENPPTEQRFVPEAMTPEQVEATARRAAREVIEDREQPAPEPEVPRGTPDDEASLPDALQDHLVVLKELAAINPAYRDIAKRQKEFWRKDEQYRSRWEQANPGHAAFDPDAADHSEFYRKNEPIVLPRDFKAAEKSIILREAEERAVTRVRKEQEPMLREMKANEAKAAVDEARADAVEEIFSAVPEFKDKFTAKKLSLEAIKKMEEANPVLAEIANEEASRVSALVKELEMFDRLKGQHEVNAQVRPILETEFAECEAALLAKAEVREGRKILPYNKAIDRAQRIYADPKLRPEQKNRAIEDLNSQYWWVQASDVKKHIVAKSLARVGKYAERFAKTATPPPKTTASNGQHATSAVAAQPKPAATPTKPSGKAGLARGTSTASVSDVADNSPRGRNDSKNREKEVVDTIFG